MVVCLVEDSDVNSHDIMGLYKITEITEAELHSEPSQTSKIEVFAKIINGFKPLTIFAKKSILDV